MYFFRHYPVAILQKCHKLELAIMWETIMLHTWMLESVWLPCHTPGYLKTLLVIMWLFRLSCNSIGYPLTLSYHVTPGYHVTILVITRRSWFPYDPGDFQTLTNAVKRGQQGEVEMSEVRDGPNCVGRVHNLPFCTCLMTTTCWSTNVFSKCSSAKVSGPFV